MTRVALREIRVSYGDLQVLEGISLDIAPSELVAVLGPSGCGKTTLLRVIAGFAEHEGDLCIDGKSFNGVPAHRREIGLVFQDYALFPHKTVAENIAFGLRLRGRSQAEIDCKIDDMVRLLQLETLGKRYPSELSGGQRQRVALARALAIDPKVLLLDEPLSALDKKLRDEMQVELRQIQRRVGITTLFVTHDQEEALALADRVVVMHKGHISQAGTPQEIYNRPVNRFVASFIGKSNIFEGRCVGVAHDCATCLVLGDVPVKVAAKGWPTNGETVYLAIRPEAVRIAHSGADADPGMMAAGKIVHVVYMGTHQEVRVMLDKGVAIDVRTVLRQTFAGGERVVVGWAEEDVTALRP